MFSSALGSLVCAATTVFSPSAPPTGQEQPPRMVRPALTVVTDFSTTFERSPPPITTGSALYSSDYETSDKDSALPRQQVVFTSAPRPFVQRAVPIQPSIDTKGTQRVFVPRRTHSAPAVLPIICPRPQRIDPAARAAFLEEPTGPPVRPMHEYAQPPKLLSYVPGARRVCRKARCHCREVMNSEYPAAVLLSASLALRVAYGEAAEVVHERLRRAVLDKDSSQAVHLLAQAWLLSGPIGRFELMREVNAQITAAVLAFHREMDEPGVWEDEAASIERKEALVRDVAEQLVSLRILA